MIGQESSDSVRGLVRLTEARGKGSYVYLTYTELIFPNLQYFFVCSFTLVLCFYQRDIPSISYLTHSSYLRYSPLRSQFNFVPRYSLCDSDIFAIRNIHCIYLFYDLLVIVTTTNSIPNPPNTSKRKGLIILTPSDLFYYIILIDIYIYLSFYIARSSMCQLGPQLGQNYGGNHQDKI